METGSSCAGLVSKVFDKSDDLNNLNVNLPNCACHVQKHSSLDELGDCLNLFLHIRDDKELTSNTTLCHHFDKTDNLNVQYDVDCEDIDGIESFSLTVQKGLSKSLSYPFSGKKPVLTSCTDGVTGEGENDTAAGINQSSCESIETRSLSLPIPLKLVPAMKGSREKLGKPREKLTVTWAPDVYDPPPSSTSTYVMYNKPRRKGEKKKNFDGKKNGKSKQKRKYSKGNTSKDKKPAQKYCRGTNDFYQLLEGEDEDVLAVRGLDISKTKTDSYCGSAFLKQSVTNLHFSVAEAT